MTFKRNILLCNIIMFAVFLIPLDVKASGLLDGLLDEDVLDSLMGTENGYDDEPEELLTESTVSLADDVYIIEFDGVGSVKSTIPGSGTYESAIFWFDDTVDYDLLIRDYDKNEELGGLEDYFGSDSSEEIVKYKSGETLLANGEYCLIVTNDNSSGWGQIEFRIENDLGVAPDIDTFDFGLGDLITTESIEIIPEIKYDSNSGKMVYKYNNSVLCYTSVPIGGFAVGRATVLAPNGILTVEYNGETIAYPDDGTFSDPGVYDIMVSTYAEDENTSICVFHIPFVIIDSLTNYVECMPAPLNFVFQEVKLNQKPYEFTENQVFLKDDGHYEITVRSLDDSTVSLTYYFDLDTRAPEFVFDKSLKKSGVKAPLSVKMDEEGSIYLIQQGKYVELSDSTFQSSGKYELIAVDMAGNESEITFFVINSFNFANDKIYIVVAVILITVLVWFIVTRRRYRV